MSTVTPTTPMQPGTYNPALPQGTITDIVESVRGVKPEDLTPKQITMWDDTMSLMAWTAPGFRHLFYKLLQNNNGKYSCLVTRRVPVAATDAKNILINPDTFFKYDLRERVFIIGHEIIHNVFHDVPFIFKCRRSGTVPMSDGTTMPFDERSMQHAMDYRINALLKESKIGKPPAGVLLDPAIAGPNDSVIDSYKKVYEKHEQDGSLGGPGNEGFDTVLDPGGSNGQPDPSAQNEQQWQVETKAAQTIEAMRSQGKMSGALQRMFEEILNPTVPWTDHIRGIFNRKVGNGQYSWKKLDRRYITRDLAMPGKTGNGAGWIVVWCDTSGSMSTKEISQYLAELSAIVDDCQPSRISIVWCDADIHQIDEVEEANDMAHVVHDKVTNGAGGGGGTNVQPVFDWINEQVGERPEVFIGFTDGYVSFPESQPDFLSIWAMTTEVTPPWGDTVRIHPERDDG